MNMYRVVTATGRAAMARSNDKRPLRSLVYVSDAQLGDIVDSLDTRTQRSIAAQLTIDFKLLGVTLSRTPGDSSLRNRSRVARLTVAEQYLRQHRQIGGVTSGGTWIDGQLDMGWKPLQDGKTVLFCGRSGSLLVVLAGPADDLLSTRHAGGEQASSYPATVKDAIAPGADMGQFWHDLETMAGDVFVMPQPVRFLARVIDRRQPGGDPPRPAIVFATPLYVEYADPAPVLIRDNLGARLQAFAWPRNAHERRRNTGALIAATLVIVAGAVTIPILASQGGHVGQPGPQSSQSVPSATSPPTSSASASSSATTSVPTSSRGLLPPVTDHFQLMLTDPNPRLPPNGVALSPDGKYLAVGAESNEKGYIGGAIYVFDSGTGQNVKTLTDPGTTGVEQVTYSPNGRYLATADDNGNVYVWDTRTWNLIRILTGPDSVVLAVEYSPNGRFLAASGDNGHIYLWDTSTWRVIQAIL